MVRGMVVDILSRVENSLSLSNNYSQYVSICSFTAKITPKLINFHRIQIAISYLQIDIRSTPSWLQTHEFLLKNGSAIHSYIC